ncbi:MULTISPECIES: hypothetical protein [Amycolatopsis]|uniref:Uncharacterized protein n=1 Tax=Amycolatopsis dendrobii TaxID=2760662 RepID=A0A7W3ZAR0_9PSEU|nr:MULTISPECIES: hypothetical protein [Amycolatopsis]MBB1154721.1 hypothetical protein [Amycolatopsis dendrobii]UKD56466.1 hypothetical protein L3Q65_07025 [Amycolatopsis sp. FU40]
MAPSRLGSVQRVLLLLALALGVAVMHHVPSPGAGHAMTSQMSVEAHSVTPAPVGPAVDSGMPAGEHSMLHLCLAVLYAAGALVLGLLVFRRYTAAKAVFDGTRGSPAADRPPDRRGRAVLTSLCVLRT